ncbi:MAG: hypothetical protein ACK52I_08640 [Pseudomonadota bacterium]
MQPAQQVRPVDRHRAIWCAMCSRCRDHGRWRQAPSRCGIGAWGEFVRIAHGC